MCCISKQNIAATTAAIDFYKVHNSTDMYLVAFVSIYLDTNSIVFVE